jgi:glycosyltransferase involved in cell wall biosynthesis
MISIIIRAYNAQKYIKRAINSALIQDFPDYELVVIDDGSTDNTPQILESLEDPRLNIFYQENRGPIEAGYEGLRRARGEAVIFLDSDDQLKVNTISTLANALKANSELAFAYGDYEETNLATGQSTTISCTNILHIIACGVLFRKSILIEVGFWDRRLIFPEHDLILRISKKYSGTHVPEPLYVYSRHPESLSANRTTIEKGLQQLREIYGDLDFKEYL